MVNKEDGVPICSHHELAVSREAYAIMQKEKREGPKLTQKPKTSWGGGWKKSDD